MSHRGHGAVVQGLISKQNSVFNENGAGSQDEGGKQVDVDVVSGAAELPERNTNVTTNRFPGLCLKAFSGPLLI